MASSINLEGKIALVTGASRGIGSACAEMLAAHGAKIMLNAVGDEKTLAVKAAELEKKYGQACWSYLADAGDAASVTELYRYLLSKAGRLDVLVANAGVIDDAVLGMITPQQIEHVLSVNVVGALNHMQMASRIMRRNSEGGSIIALSSIIGRVGNSGQTLYGASKAAVIGAVYSAAKELASSQIRVNAIAPGFIQTNMTDTLNEAVRKQHMAGIGMQRIGAPEDVARAALFFASDLSLYVTGQVLGVDGGMIV
ncbi:MAG: SDR family oxidoreductase [Bdellovibrionales bacterium]